MLILVLGKGKTGSLVAEVARERGHGVRALDIDENPHASALTAPNLAGVDVVIDFTAPEAAVENIRAVLALGGRIVVGTTGWYSHLAETQVQSAKARGGLLYGTNFSIGVQKLFQLTAELAKLEGYQFSIDETHHVTKLDAPSGTAITLKEIILGVGRAPKPISTCPLSRTAWAMPRASTWCARRVTAICWSCATTRIRGAALRWARCAAPSGWPANPARGSSARSSRSYNSGQRSTYVYAARLRPALAGCAASRRPGSRRRSQTSAGTNERGSSAGCEREDSGIRGCVHQARKSGRARRWMGVFTQRL